MPDFGKLLNAHNRKFKFVDRVLDPDELRHPKDYALKMKSLVDLTEHEMSAMTHEEVCRASLRWQSEFSASNEGFVTVTVRINFADSHGNALVRVAYSLHGRQKQEADQRAESQVFALETHWCAADLRKMKQVPAFVSLQTKAELDEMNYEFPKTRREEFLDLFKDKDYVRDKLTPYCIEMMQSTETQAIGRMFDALMCRHVLYTFKWRSKK